MSEKLVLVRHFQDQDNLFYKNDSPIEQSELLKAGAIAQEIVTQTTEKGFSCIHIVASHKKRAEMTAVEIARRIGDTIPVTVETDSRIRELDHGQYILPKDYKPGDYFPPLQDAWKAFFKETFGEEDIWYRFGDPIATTGGYKYPELASHFSKYGENQLEFSIRFYSFLADFCLDYQDKKDVLPVVVTHQALTARVAEVARIAEKVKSGSITTVTQGKLPLLEWEQYQELSGNKNVFIEFGGLTTISLIDLYDFVDFLVSEHEYLKTLRASRN